MVENNSFDFESVDDHGQPTGLGKEPGSLLTQAPENVLYCILSLNLGRHAYRHRLQSRQRTANPADSRRGFSALPGQAGPGTPQPPGHDAQNARAGSRRLGASSGTA